MGSHLQLYIGLHLLKFQFPNLTTGLFTARSIISSTANFKIDLAFKELNLLVQYNGGIDLLTWPYPPVRLVQFQPKHFSGDEI